MQVYAIVVVFMHIKARLLFGLYIFCLHVALRKRYFGSCNGMMRYCREIGLWIFVMDRSQHSSEYYASSITKTIFCLTLTVPVMSIHKAMQFFSTFFTFDIHIATSAFYRRPQQSVFFWVLCLVLRSERDTETSVLKDLPNRKIVALSQTRHL